MVTRIEKETAAGWNNLRFFVAVRDILSKDSNEKIVEYGIKMILLHHATPRMLGSVPGNHRVASDADVLITVRHLAGPAGRRWKKIMAEGPDIERLKMSFLNRLRKTIGPTYVPRPRVGRTKTSTAQEPPFVIEKERLNLLTREQRKFWDAYLSTASVGEAAKRTHRSAVAGRNMLCKIRAKLNFQFRPGEKKRIRNYHR